MINLEDNFALRVQQYFLDKGWEEVSAMMMTVVGLVFILTMFVTFVFGLGSYIFSPENSKEIIKMTFIPSTFFFLLSCGVYIEHLFKKEGVKNGN